MAWIKPLGFSQDQRLYNTKHPKAIQYFSSFLLALAFVSILFITFPFPTHKKEALDISKSKLLGARNTKLKL